jgi:hypothetical protein
MKFESGERITGMGKGILKFGGETSSKTAPLNRWD